jgi:hypothetical protein
MECIICRETGPEPLLDNSICECKYKVHSSCWIDYVHTTTTVKCLLCRKEIQRQPPPLPTIQVLSTPMLNSYPPTEIRISAPPQPSLAQPNYTKYNILIKLSCVVVFILLAILFLRFIIF